MVSESSSPGTKLQIKLNKYMKQVFKYGTGQEIPKGAVYLSTQVETKAYELDGAVITRNEFVWHYFLVGGEEWSVGLSDPI